MTACRFGFAYDIEDQIDQVQADIDCMQRQLQLFDKNELAASMHAEKHAVEATQPQGNVPRPALSTPFLFVGVLSVAGNAGTYS